MRRWLRLGMTVVALAILAWAADSIARLWLSRHELLEVQGRFLRDDPETQLYVRASFVAITFLLAFGGWAVVRAARRCRRARRESVLQYRGLFLDSRVAMLVLDPSNDGQIIHANAAAGDFFRCGVDDLVGLSSLQLTTLDEAEAREHMEYASAGTRSHFVLPLGLAHGESRMAEVYTSPIQLDGRPLLLVIAHDVTERVRIQEELEVSRQKLLWAETCANMGYWELDAEVRVANLSTEALRIHGLSEQGPIPMKDLIERWLHPEDRDAIRGLVEDVRAGAGMPEIECRAVRPDGTVRHIHVRGEAVRGPGGRLESLMGTVQDITARKVIENRLRRSESRFRTLVETCPNGIVEVSPSGMVEFANPAFAKMTGYTCEELVGGGLDMLLPDGSTRRMLSERVVHILREHPEPKMTQQVYRTKSGRCIDVEVDWDYERDDQGEVKGFVAVVTEITERRLHEQRILKYQRQLKSLASDLSAAEERERRRFAAILHDGIGQDLFAAKANLGLARNIRSDDQRGELIGETLDMLDRIMSDARNLTFELCPPVLYEIGLEAALEWLAGHVAQTQRLNVRYRGPEAPPAPVEEGLRGVLYQAARELLFNVAKHAGACQVTLSLAYDDRTVRVEVADDGRGFDPAEIEASLPGQQGFGLFHIRERIESFGGRLACESSPGRGSRMALEAPLVTTAVEEEV